MFTQLLRGVYLLEECTIGCEWLCRRYAGFYIIRRAVLDTVERHPHFVVAKDDARIQQNGRHNNSMIYALMTSFFRVSNVTVRSSRCCGFECVCVCV